jgi:hypothetical protein
VFVIEKVISWVPAAPPCPETAIRSPRTLHLGSAEDVVDVEDEGAVDEGAVDEGVVEVVVVEAGGRRGLVGWVADGLDEQALSTSAASAAETTPAAEVHTLAMGSPFLPASLDLRRPLWTCAGRYRPAPPGTAWHRPAPPGTAWHRPAPPAPIVAQHACVRMRPGSIGQSTVPRPVAGER